MISWGNCIDSARCGDARTCTVLANLICMCTLSFGSLLLSSVALLNAAQQPSNCMQVLWDSPSMEPALNMKKQHIIGGGMPIGNGTCAGARSLMSTVTQRIYR